MKKPPTMPKNNDCRMLCIDTSTSHFGFALYVNGDLQKVFGLDAEGTYGLDKFISLTITFGKILQEQKPNLVVLEQPVPVSFSRNLMSLNQVVGMVLAMATSYGASVDWVHNRTAKKLSGVTAKGKDGKKQAIELMKAKYPDFSASITNDHIADAVIVGEAYKQIWSE